MQEDETLVVSRPVRVVNRIINGFIYLVLFLFLVYALAAIWDIYQQYHRGAVSEEILHLKPGEPDYSFDSLLAINPDVCAWITLDGTKVDYPVLQGKDNAEYLDKDIYRKFYVGGSIFMDYRGNKGFTDSYSLLHGHHMDQGMMFGDLDKYAKEDFFNANTTGTLYTPETRYRLEIFAYMSVDAYDAVIYDPGNKDAAAQQALLDYIKEHTVNYHEIELTAEDRILAMSTCASAFTNGRSVVLARMTEIGRNEAGVVKDIQDK